MAMTVSTYHDVIVLTVKDELTAETAPLFAEQASRALADGAAHLVVDCSQLRGMDSAGLEALLKLQEDCEEATRTVRLCALDATCAKILEITRLGRRFEMFDDLEAAVKSCA